MFTKGKVSGAKSKLLSIALEKNSSIIIYLIKHSSNKFDFTNNWHFETSQLNQSLASETSLVGLSHSIKGKKPLAHLKKSNKLNEVSTPSLKSSSKSIPKKSLRLRNSKSKIAHSTFFQKKNKKFHFRFEPSKQSLTKIIDSSSEFSMISGNIGSFQTPMQSCASIMTNGKISEEVDNASCMNPKLERTQVNKCGSVKKTDR